MLSCNSFSCLHFSPGDIYADSLFFYQPDVFLDTKLSQFDQAIYVLLRTSYRRIKLSQYAKNEFRKCLLHVHRQGKQTDLIKSEDDYQRSQLMTSDSFACDAANVVDINTLCFT